MHIPTSIVLLLAVSASHALVIAEKPDLLSADLTVTADNIIDAVPVVPAVISGQLEEGQKVERSTELVTRGTARYYGFRFTSALKAFFAGVDIVWTFASGTNVAHVVNYIKCINPTDNQVLVRIRNSVNDEVLSVFKIGAHGFVELWNPRMTKEMNLEVVNV